MTEPPVGRNEHDLTAAALAGDRWPRTYLLGDATLAQVLVAAEDEQDRPGYLSPTVAARYGYLLTFHARDRTCARSRFNATKAVLGFRPDYGSSRAPNAAHGRPQGQPATCSGSPSPSPGRPGERLRADDDRR
jgi:hypothetical protein